MLAHCLLADSTDSWSAELVGPRDEVPSLQDANTRTATSIEHSFRLKNSIYSYKITDLTKCKSYEIRIKHYGQDKRISLHQSSQQISYRTMQTTSKNKCGKRAGSAQNGHILQDSGYVRNQDVSTVEDRLMIRCSYSTDSLGTL